MAIFSDSFCTEGLRQRGKRRGKPVCARGSNRTSSRGVPCQVNPRARATENQPNKLLERQHEWLDAGAAQAAVRADSDLEPVGEVHGTANSGRKGSGR
jgi:hypothetical protein